MSTRSDARNTTAPHTRRIGWAKLSAVYCVAGLGSGNPQSQAGPRRTARDANRWMISITTNVEMVMKTNTSRPLEELRLGAIGTIDIQAMPVCGGIACP